MAHLLLYFTGRKDYLMTSYQRTIKKPITCEGIGLHSGMPVQMTLRPARAGAGITFIRTDRGNAAIKAAAANTSATSYATTLCRSGVSVKTVEHLLSALAGLTIDNLFIEIDAEELPIMDGSARIFVRLIAEAGIEIQDKPRPLLKVLRPVFVREGGKQLAIWPAETTCISCFIDFNHPMLKEQSLQYRQSEEAFLRDISDARTFGFLSEVRTLQENGLAKGASLDNAVALDRETVVNKEGLRYQDEFVRHKILDLIGDLSLAGMPIIGHIVAHKSGHGLNAQMVGKLLSSPRDWVLVNASGRTKALPGEIQYQHAAL